MKTTTVLLFGVICIALAIAVATKLKPADKNKKGAFVKKPVATENEQGMFWRLVECFQPAEFVVLAQVSFGALLNAKDGASRYSFSQKIADFVLLDRSFKVIAVIELDDASHKGRGKQDAARDEILTSAGYKVLRYKKTPDRVKLLSDVNALNTPIPPITPV